MQDKKKQLITLLNQGTLYGITASNCYKNSNLEMIETLLRSGVKIIQYREKEMKKEVIFGELVEIRKLVSQYNGILIVNDHPDVCKAIDADGVHIGQDDGDINEIRKYLGENKIIGLSTHCPDHLEKAKLLPIDYIGVGPAFKTNTKPEKKVAGLDYIEHVARFGKIPAVAIGGIDMKNLEKVFHRGIKNICMIQGLYHSGQDIKVTAKSVLQKISEHSPKL